MTRFVNKLKLVTSVPLDSPSSTTSPADPPGERAAPADRNPTGRAPLWLIGWSDDHLAALRSSAGRSLSLEAISPAAALERLRRGEDGVLCLGSELAGGEALAFVEELPAALPDGGEARPPLVLVLAGGADPSPFQPLIARDRIYYWTQQPVVDADLVAILESAVERHRVRGRSDRRSVGTEALPHELQTIVEVARRVTLQRDLHSAGELTVEATREVTEGDRAYYLVYDEEHEVLFSGDPGSRDFREESAAVGLVSFVARTGRALLRDRMDRDPRYEASADDPHGDGSGRLLAVPVQGSGRAVFAVLVSIRDAERPPFTDRHLAHMEILADQVASSFSQLALQARIDQDLRRREREMRQGVDAVFRTEALESYLAGRGTEGDVLRISPAWTRWTYWLLLGLLAAAIAFSLLASVKEYASGPAVVRMEGSRDLTATTAGVVSAVLVEPGAAVAAGQPLMLFYGAPELAELNRIEREFELHLLDRLRDPSDRGAEAALLSLRAQRELARSRLEERTLRAPEAGRVADVRVREGQSVSPGGALLSLSSDGAEAGGSGVPAGPRPTLVALLPGQYRPLLEEGMELRFEVQGYEYAFVRTELTGVSQEIVGPQEARRYLGPVLEDVVGVTGPVVLVEARLPEATFAAGDDRYAFHDGLFGRAEVAVRSERLLLALFPRLKILTEEGTGDGR